MFAPAATFFLVYEGVKRVLLSMERFNNPSLAPLVHMVAASAGEVVSLNTLYGDVSHLNKN